MSDLSPIDVGNITEQSTDFKAAISEYIFKRFGRLLNFFRAKFRMDHVWEINGRASYFAAKNNVDNMFVLPWDCEVVDVIIQNDTAGSTNQHEFDIKASTFPNGAWTSILTETPKITTSAASFATCGIGDVVTGCVAPTLAAGALTLSAKTRLRMDVITAMAGSKGAALTVRIKPR